MTHRKALLGISAAAALASGGAAVAADRQGVQADSRGVTLREGPLTLNLGGRLHVDATHYNETGVEVDDRGVRRARLELSGAIGESIRFRVDREFAGGGGWRNLWVGVRPSRTFEIRAGNFVTPFSQEELQSSNASALIERSAMSALAPSYGLGAQVAASGRTWSLSVGGFDDGLADDEGTSSSRGRGLVARATFTPLSERRRTVHLGIATELRDDDDADLRLQTRAAAFAPAQARTGRIADVATVASLGLEGSFKADRLLVQGQYVRTAIERRDRADLALQGWFLQGSWVLQGEQRPYNARTGLFGAVSIAHHGPTIELAARYSELDLASATLQRGQAQTATIGATWYASENARLMLNLTRAKTLGVARATDRSADIVAVRLQSSF